jgi:hypothetical protein
VRLYIGDSGFEPRAGFGAIVWCSGGGAYTVVAGDKPVLSSHEATTLAFGIVRVLALLAG